MKTNLSLKFSFACIFAMLMLFTGCTNEIYDCPDYSSMLVFRLTEENPQPGKQEEIHCNADAQTITLRVVSIMRPELELPYPTELLFRMVEWNEERGCFMDGLPNSTNQPDDFYHAFEDTEDGVPVVKISLKRNDTGETRKVEALVFSNKMYNNHPLYGCVDIYQEPETGEATTIE